MRREEEDRNGGRDTKAIIDKGRERKYVESES